MHTPTALRRQAVTFAVSFAVAISGAVIALPGQSQAAVLRGPVAATSLSIQVHPGSTDYGKTVTVTGYLRDSVPTGVPDATVKLFERPAGVSTWDQIAKDTTNADGAYKFARKARSCTRYMVEFSGSAGYAASTSSIKSLLVHRVVTAKLTDRRIKVGGATRVYGHIEAKERGVKVQLQEHHAGAWIALLNSTTGRQGSYHWNITATRHGRFTLRVVCHETRELLAGASRHIVLRAHN